MKPRCSLIVALMLFAAGFFRATTARAQDDPPPPVPAPAASSVVSPPPLVDPKPLPPKPGVEDGAPVGVAAPPTEAALRLRSQSAVVPVCAGLEIFAEYKYRNVFGPDGNRTWFHAFDVPRVHGAIEGEWQNVARGRLVLEATRSASEGSLVGVAGDSLVLRVREAYGAYRIIDVLEISAGVVPTLTAPNLDGTWMLRAVAPSALEANGLVSPADLGVKIRLDEPHGYGWIATAAYNGDGYTSRELNRGKSVESAIEVHPLAGLDANTRALRALGMFGSFVSGSTGTSRARANRLTGGVVWQGARVRAGAFATYAVGVAQLGAQHAIVMSAFARVEPVPRVLLGARLDHVARNTNDVGGAPAVIGGAGAPVLDPPSDFLTTIWGTAGYRIALPIEALIAVSRSIPTTRAQTELPGADAWEARTILRVVF